MAKEKNEPTRETEEEEISIDMTQAKTFEPLPERKALLAAISKWKYGRTLNGRKVDYEFTIIEPSELANRKVQESVSLENEYTLGRLQNILIAVGFSEDEVKVKNFKCPKEEDMLGLQTTIFCRTRHSDVFGDRSQVSRFRPAAAYKEAAAY